jgi:dTDP-4-dehydrorhamnose 3,5-epimerase-like enzyme
VYLCDNFQQGTVRGYHYHRHEQKIFICLQGAVKFVLLPGLMFEADGDLWEPQTFVLSADRNDALLIPANYANGWQSLTDDAILLGMSDRTVEQSREDDIRSDPTEIHPEYWETKWR